MTTLNYLFHNPNYTKHHELTVMCDIQPEPFDFADYNDPIPKTVIWGSVEVEDIPNASRQAYDGIVIDGMKYEQVNLLIGTYESIIGEGTVPTIADVQNVLGADFSWVEKEILMPLIERYKGAFAVAEETDEQIDAQITRELADVEALALKHPDKVSKALNDRVSIGALEIVDTAGVKQPDDKLKVVK